MTLDTSKGFRNGDPGSHKGVTNTWYTPKYILDSLGEFDLDPCSNSTRPFNTARYHVSHDKGVDGLDREWFGRVWCNPPYGKFTGEWLSRLAEHGNGVALVFSRTETRWAQEALERADAVNFIKGRIAFGREDGERGGTANNGSMLLAYGKANVESLYTIEGLIMNLRQQEKRDE